MQDISTGMSMRKGLLLIPKVDMLSTIKVNNKGLVCKKVRFGFAKYLLCIVSQNNVPNLTHITAWDQLRGGDETLK